MADDKITDEQITEAAASPSQVMTDGVQVTARPLADLIALQKHQDAKAAAKKKNRGIRFMKFIPEGPG